MYGDEYSIPGKRTQFWEKIALLATEEVGREVKNAQSLVKKQLDKYNAIMEKRLMDSGKAEPETEWEQTMDRWKKRRDSVCFRILRCYFTVTNFSEW
jgi:hypothetical protein